jgi:hypothetical protein
LALSRPAGRACAKAGAANRTAARTARIRIMITPDQR